MDLEWTDEQQALREAVRGFLAEHHDSEVVRRLEDDPVGYDPEVWQGLAQMDLLGLTIPEQYGGAGMGPLEQVIVYEEFGRALAMVPHLTTVVAGAGALLAAGTEEQKQQWLPRMVRGETIWSVAWPEPGRSETARGIATRAERDGDGWRLTGTKIRVPYASSAERILTLARTGEGGTDIGLFLIDPTGPGVTLTHTTVLSSECEYQVDLEGAPAAEVIGDPTAGWDLFAGQVLPDIWIAVAAYAIGGARKALEMSVEYAKERVQFDRPIGSFQGLAHPIADLATEIEGVQILVWQAAWRRARGAAPRGLVAMAKFAACDVYRRMTRQAQQVYGGIGFTRAIDVQLYTRRAKQLEVSWGGPAVTLEEIAAAELDGTPFVHVQSALD